jgi:hypothetical protein
MPEKRKPGEYTGLPFDKRVTLLGGKPPECPPDAPQSPTDGLEPRPASREPPAPPLG